MRRIFQKHGKIILAILGVFLMIVFALPSISGQRDYGNLPAGKLNGKTITHNDLQAAASEMAIVRTLLGMYGDYEIQSLGLDERDPQLHWLLQVKEAAKYGFDTMNLAEAQLDPAQIQMALSKMPNARRQDVITAFNHLNMIESLQNFVLDVPISMTALEQASNQTQSRVRVAYATLDAAQGWQRMPEPTDDQVKKQFELYKGIVHAPLPTSDFADRGEEPPEINGHHFPFGYKYPDRVTVEYLVFDRQALRDRMKHTVEDDKEAYTYYREHPDEFKSSAATPGIVSTQPSVKSFESVKDELVRRQIEDRVKSQLKVMTERVMLKAQDPWKTTDSVPRAKWAPYKDIVEDLGRRSGDYKPELKTIDAMMSAEDLARVPGIGKATSMDQQQYPFPMLATHVKELAVEGKKDPLARLSLQVGVEGKVLQDENGNVYIYRVTGAEKSHEPASLEEVRSQVIEDLKKAANYERLVKQAAELAESAKKQDLTALAADKKIPVSKTPEFSQVGEIPGEIKNIRGFVKQAFSIVPPGAKSSLPSNASTQAAEEAATQAAGVGNTTVVQDDSALRAYALELISVRPAAAAAFGQEVQAELKNESQSPTLLRAAHQEIAVAFHDYLGLDSLMKRLKYEPNTPLAAKKE